MQNGLAESREKAQRLILAGQVTVNGQIGSKPGQQVSAEAEVALLGQLPYVSRGGSKLQGALDAFGVVVTNKIVADIGASTGGFTDCLLQRGAARVYAIDVGYGQLAWSLRQDPRVVVLERTNIRYLEGLPELVRSRDGGRLLYLVDARLACDCQAAQTRGRDCRPGQTAVRGRARAGWPWWGRARP